jgi:large conductance mechanosensitive channel
MPVEFFDIQESPMLKGFRDFILRGNVMDLAVAVIIGGAFGKIVTALVADIINPLIGATVGQPDFSSVILHVGSGVFKVGDFLNAVIDFLLISAVVYFALVLPMNTVMAKLKKPEAPAAPTTKPCPECLSDIPLAARRCAHCAQPVA